MSGVARMIARQGQSWTMTPQVLGSKDNYGDRAISDDTPIPVKAIRTETAEADAVLTVRGEERKVDVELIVDSSLDVSDIEDTTERAPRFTSPEGIEFDAVAVGREGNIKGFHRIFLSKSRSST